MPSLLRRFLSTLVAIATVAAEELDLSCEGYFFGGIDWSFMRRRLEVFADKYLDRPQLLAEEFDIAMNYAVQYWPGNRCVVGDLSLRFFVWLRVKPEDLNESLRAVMEGSSNSLMLTDIMEETWKWFWEMPYKWQEILDSGWPIFSILATVQQRLVSAGGSAPHGCETELLTPFVDTFDTAIAVSTHQCTAVLLEATLVQCPEASASALVALADNLRTSMWQQSNLNRYYHFSSASPEEQPREDDVEILLSRAEGLLRSSKSWASLTSPWPFWRLLDRLGAKEVVNVTSDTSWFWMHVFPHRVRSDGIISNRIRGTSQAYCIPIFQDQVRRLASSRPSRRIRLVEAGPHIGDCMLWAAAEYGQRLSATCVEPVAQVVSLFKRSIAANHFEEMIDVHHAFLGNKDTHEGGISIPWRRPDSLVQDDVDVFKIHTNGGERQILDGAAELFKNHQVRTVLVHSAEFHQLWGSAEFLLQRGYHVSVDGRRISVKDADWLRQRIVEVGGLQMLATLETGDRT